MLFLVPDRSFLSYHFRGGGKRWNCVAKIIRFRTNVLVIQIWLPTRTKLPISWKWSSKFYGIWIMSDNFETKRVQSAVLKIKKLTLPFKNCEAKKRMKRAEKISSFKIFADRSLQKLTNHIQSNYPINQSHLSHLSQSKYNAPRINVSFELSFLFQSCELNFRHGPY